MEPILNYSDSDVISLLKYFDMMQINGLNPNMIANNLISSRPTHPGEVLREEIESRGITQTKLANEIGIRISLLNELINGKRDFTIEYAMMIEAALDIDADFWMRMQMSYNLKMAKRNKTFMEKLSKIHKIAAVL